MNSLLVPLIILTICIAILTILIITLYCKTLKYIKNHSGISENVTGIPDEKFWENLEEENTDLEPDILPKESTVSETEVSSKESVLLPETANLFGLSTIESTVEVDIIQAAKDAIESLTPFAEAQNIKLHLSTTCEELMIMAVPESIRILFRNIIDNSIKYMGRAGHMIITISLLGDDIFVILKDTGKGLNEEETTHIFELNFQGSNRVSGNGLGLTQSKMIVETFGGTIYAKSSPENGMAIYIQLPVSKKEC